MVPSEEAQEEASRGARLPQPRHAIGFFLLLIAATFALVMLAAMLLMALGVDAGFKSQPASALLIAVQALVMIAVALWFLRRGRFPIRATLGLRPAPRPAYLWGPLGLIALGEVMGQLAALLLQAAPELASEGLADLVRLSHYTNPWSFGIYALAISLGPGLSEELAFRGVILAGFRSRWGSAAAVTLSAVAFALYHLDPLHALLAFPAGLWLGALVVRTGSLYPAVVAHAVNNLWSTVEAAAWQAARPGIDPLEIVLSSAYPPIVTVAAAIVLLVAVYVLRGLTPSPAPAASRDASATRGGPERFP